MNQDIDYLAAKKTTGGRLLAIRNNANLSKGWMFALSTFSGNSMAKEWAAERMRWDPNAPKPAEAAPAAK